MGFDKVSKFCLAATLLLSASGFATDKPAADNSAAAKPGYAKGSLTMANDSGHKTYNLKAGSKIYQIGNCGDFQNAQEVEFMIKEDKIYIAHDGAKDYKCQIQSTTESLDPNLTPTPNDLSGPHYMKGTILGFMVRRDVHVSGNASSMRKAKVYEVQGPDMVYQADYCGAFQAGQFSAGQEVEFRVDVGGGRLYIRHDGNKEYSCQLEGTRKSDAASGGATDSASSAAPAAAAAAASTTPASNARLSIASVPDGADIEIDENFVGNTPSDLAVAEGEHSIVVKKAGYKSWERKLKVVAGSSIHLNAEMEKSANP